MSNILCFDYGVTKIGVAVGNTITANASALKIIRAVKSNPNWDEIDKLIQEWDPKIIVIGKPIENNNNDLIIKKAQKFGDELFEKYKIQISYTDESFSSIEAYSQYKELRQHGFKKQNNIDHLAAKIILERWLLTNKEK